MAVLQSDSKCSRTIVYAPLSNRTAPCHQTRSKGLDTRFDPAGFKAGVFLLQNARAGKSPPGHRLDYSIRYIQILIEYLYSGCQKNVPLFNRFFLQPLMPLFLNSGHYDGKRYKPVISQLSQLTAAIKQFHAEPISNRSNGPHSSALTITLNNLTIVKMP